MVAALRPQRGQQGVPVLAVTAARIAEGLVDARFHAFEAADVDVAVVVVEEPRDVIGAGANPVLHVLLRFVRARAKTRS